MKTLREMMDQIDEITRRGLLKGAGAAALSGATGAKADWNAYRSTDPLTNITDVTGFTNPSNENSKVILEFHQWPRLNNRFVTSLNGLPFEPPTPTIKIANVPCAMVEYRALIGKKLYNNLTGGLFLGSSGTGMLIGIQGGWQEEIGMAIAQAANDSQDIKIQIINKIYTFSGRRNFEEDQLEETSPDALAKIDQLTRK